MIRSILVPIDVSTFGEQALPVATAIARRCGAELDLALAEDPRAELPALSGLGMGGSAALPGVLPIDAQVKPVRETRQAYLGALARQVRAANPGVPVHAEVLEGAPVDALVERAGLNVDLIVMSTHARGGLSRVVLGSVSDRLVREVSVPVVLVKPEASPGPLNAPVRPQFRRILVPLDGSALSESILDPMLDVIGNDRSEVRCTLLLVEPPMFVVPLASLPALANPVQDQGSGSHAASADYLEEVAKRLRASGLRVEWRIVVHTLTSRAILDLADELAADLIALATHGRGGVRRFLIGSVADEVLRGAETTVLMFRAPSTLSSH